MAKADSVSPRDFEALLDNLRGWLHSEVSISEPHPMTFGGGSRNPLEQEGVEVTVHVRNDAPLRMESGEVVFLGVGLRVSDGRGRDHERGVWASDIRKSRPSDRQDLRDRYSQGTWFGGSEQFPAETSDERSFGDILFPGESVVYEMRIPTSYLPYLKIQVEGSVSRRHLFHFVQSMEGFERWTRPLLVETLHALSAIDIHRPVRLATSTLPEFGPRTTLEEVKAYRQVVGEARDQIKSTSQALNSVFYSAPNKEIRDHLKQVMGRYLASVGEACTKALDALATGDMERMRDAAGSLRQQFVASEEVDRRTLQLLSELGVPPEEVGFSRSSG